MNIANQISILRILLIPIFIVLVYFEFPYHHIAAAVSFVLIASTDYFDGYFARKYNLDSSAGRIIDPLADKLLVMAGFVVLTGKGIPAWATLIVVIREILITGIRSLTHEPKKAAFKASWPAKFKTVFQMIAIVVVLLGIPYSIGVVYAAVALTLYSGIEYLILHRAFLKEFLG